jgi:nucleoporin SEH1
VEFDQNLEPCYAAIREGMPRDGLGVVVAGMHTARIWRSKVISHDVSLGSGSSREFYRAADLGDQRALVRDVAWAKGSIRGYDLCATACKDGLVRVFEVHTPGPEGDGERSGAVGEIKTPGASFGDYPPSSSSHTPHRSETHSYNNSLSGISASLASARGSTRGEGTGQVRHVVREVARLDGHGGPVWRVEFDDDGLVLGSTGDDGRVRLWRRRPDGSWGASGELGISRAMPTG